MQGLMPKAAPGRGRRIFLPHGAIVVFAIALLAGATASAAPAGATPGAQRAEVTVPKVAVGVALLVPERATATGKPARSPTLTADADWRRKMLAHNNQDQSALAGIAGTVPPDLLEQRGRESRQAAGLGGKPALPHDDNAVPVGRQSFPSPDAAADALATALKGGKSATLRQILGPRAQAILFSGEPQADRALIGTLLAAYQSRHSFAPISDRRMELRVGANEWPIPVPLVHAETGWWFDTEAGMERVLDRRIGRNEFTSIRVLLACVAAQTDYFQRMRAIDGKGFYASRILSSPGRRNGLYWSVQAGQVQSPLAPLILEAIDAGYPGGVLMNGRPIPYQGYFFRILQQQGAQAQGGLKSYMRQGKMVGGFALLAWPAAYGTSGIMTFIAGPDGTVFQQNLGVRTGDIATALDTFNPDAAWVKIVLTGGPSPDAQQ